MAIEEVKVRAIINVGSLSIETPYVTNFSVTKTRGQVSTMSASLKVIGSEVATADGEVRVRAGIRGDLETIFTGDIYKINVTPCWEDPTYVMLNIEARDFLARLEGTKFTRRQTSTEHMFSVITSADSSFVNDRFKTINEPTKFHTTPDMTSGGGVYNAGQPTSARMLQTNNGKSKTMSYKPVLGVEVNHEGN